VVREALHRRQQGGKGLPVVQALARVQHLRPESRHDGALGHQLPGIDSMKLDHGPKSFRTNFAPKKADKCVSDHFVQNSEILWHKKSTKTNIYKLIDRFSFNP
jgi:hypothetical protein